MFLKGQRDEEQVAFSMFFHMKNNLNSSSSRPIRNFSLWPPATSNQSFHEGRRSNSRKEIAENKQNLFRSEPVRHANRTFCTFAVRKVTAVSIISIATLNELVARVVDSYIEK